MAEPTLTLAELRRLICTELQMPFFRRYKLGYLTADSGSTTTLVDTDLTQRDKFWERAWLYRVASLEASLITRFDGKDNKAFLETPITAIGAGDQYEIHSVWNAYEIHAAINEAIRQVQRTYVDIVTDETLVVQENVRTYTISGLTKVPYLVHQVYLEQPASVKRGQLVSATSTTAVVESAGILSDVNTNWKISIYAGTGKGQVRSVASTASATVTVTAWTTTPDSTSKYALWDATQETYDWYRYEAVRLGESSKEFPNTLYFSVLPVSFYGMRIRIEYSSVPAALTTEAGTTVVPATYIKYAAVSALHSQQVQDNRADRELHFGEARRYKEMADEYLARNAPHKPDSMMFRQQDMYYQPDSADPLGWRNG